MEAARTPIGSRAVYLTFRSDTVSLQRNQP